MFEVIVKLVCHFKQTLEIRMYLSKLCDFIGFCVVGVGVYTVTGCEDWRGFLWVS